MGIFDKVDKDFLAKAKEKANKFEPKELNERNVLSVFNRCCNSFFYML